MTDNPSVHPRLLLAALTALALAAASASAREDRDYDTPEAAQPAAGAGQIVAQRDAASPQQEAEQRDRARERRVTREDVEPSRPMRYTVERGDTLWDIADHFLKDPWLWPEIWYVNPEIENPHLIYPGDTITLAFVEGEPRLRVKRKGVPEPEDGYVRLKPRVRKLPLDEAIPTIRAEAIRQFLNRPRVVTEDELDKAPYIVGNYDGRLISATGDHVFARGFDNGGPSTDRYSVFRPGPPFHDPDTGELLGYEAIYAGKAAVRRAADPVRLELTQASREVLNGDRLLPANRALVQDDYIPQPPDEQVDAQIIRLFDAISQVGTNQVVVVNHGEADGAEVSDVLAIKQSGGTVRDPYATERTSDTVQLPPQEVGTMMLFRVFDRVSYGLVMSATQAIHVDDRVVNP